MNRPSLEAAAVSDRDHSQLRDLSREECLALLEHAAIGRIGYVVDGLPVILPVNFVLFKDDIVFCTAKGGTLAWLSNRRRVAFEVDESHPAEREGWSVLVHGSAHEVTDPEQLDELRAGPLQSWVRTPEEHWVRINVEAISGRALDGSTN
jgi:uncharacterized protein